MAPLKVWELQGSPAAFINDPLRVQGSTWASRRDRKAICTGPGEVSGWWMEKRRKRCVFRPSLAQRSVLLPCVDCWTDANGWSQVYLVVVALCGFSFDVQSEKERGQLFITCYLHNMRWKEPLFSEEMSGPFTFTSKPAIKADCVLLSNTLITYSFILPEWPRVNVWKLYIHLPSIMQLSAIIMCYFSSISW